jgi:hypothetical protein
VSHVIWIYILSGYLMMSLLMATCSLLHSLFLCMMSHTDMLLNLSAIARQINTGVSCY